MPSYLRFLAMITVSSALMFALMYLNSYSMAHVEFSQTRMFMTLIMAGCMAVVMLLFMRSMYTNKSANRAILIGSVALMGLGVALVRSQVTVGDVAWMRAMIPHHSIAILTSERANLSDPRVRELATSIIKAQRREIAEMQSLLTDLQNRQARTETVQP